MRVLPGSVCLTLVSVIIQAVIGVIDADDVDNVLMNATQTIRKTHEIIKEITQPIQTPYLTIERSTILMQERQEISVIREENARLSITRDNLKVDCDNKVMLLTEVYNKMLATFQLEIPALRRWEKYLSVSLLKKELIVKALNEMTTYIGFLQLKKIILIQDIEVLESRNQEFFNCQNYMGLMNAEPVLASQVIVKGKAQAEVNGGNAGEDNGDSVKAGPIGLRSFGPGVDVGATLYESKKVKLDVVLEQETYINMELKNYIKFYAGYCQRKLDSLKTLIELLRRYPAGKHSLESIQREVNQVKVDVEDKYSELVPVKENFLGLIAEVRQLQARYDTLQAAADCFMVLDKFRIDQYIAQVIETVQVAEQRYSETGTSYDTYEEVVDGEPVYVTPGTPIQGGPPVNPGIPIEEGIPIVPGVPLKEVPVNPGLIPTLEPVGPGVSVEKGISADPGLPIEAGSYGPPTYFPQINGPTDNPDFTIQVGPPGPLNVVSQIKGAPVKGGYENPGHPIKG